MKHIFVLPGLLLLAACSSTGDAYTIGRNIDTVGESNARITGMRTGVDNRLEVIAYAQSVGVIATPSTTATASQNPSRIGVAGPVLNRDPNVRDQTDEKIGTLYEQALTAFKNMYNIYKNGLDGLTKDEIKDAYLIAGGDEWSEDLTDTEIQDRINDNYAAVLNKYFAPGETDTWIFEPKTESLKDVQMKLLSDDDVLTFMLDDNNQIMGINLAEEGYTRTSDKSNTFWRKDATTGTETTVTVKASGNLKYSDYGRLSKAVRSADSDETTTEFKFFAGGYDLKHIDRSDVATIAGENSLNFKGTAMGLVKNKDNETLPINGDATLNFMNGTETVDLKFSNSKWYDVKIVDTGTSQAISFTPGDEININFLVSEPSKSLAYDGMDVNYYGDRGKPSEFVGTATYTDTNGVSMDAAFGGKYTTPDSIK